MKTNSREKLRYTLFEPTVSKPRSNIELGRIDLVALHREMGVVQEIDPAIQVCPIQLSKMSTNEGNDIRIVLNEWENELCELRKKTTNRNDLKLILANHEILQILLLEVRYRMQQSQDICGRATSRLTAAMLSMVGNSRVEEPECTLLLVKREPDKKIQAMATFQYRSNARKVYLDYLVTAPCNLKLNTIERPLRTSGNASAVISYLLDLAARNGQEGLRLCGSNSPGSYYNKLGFQTDEILGDRDYINLSVQNVQDRIQLLEPSQSEHVQMDEILNNRDVDRARCPGWCTIQ